MRARFLLMPCCAALLVAPVSGAQCITGTEVRETELVGVGSDYARLTELADSSLVTPRLARRLSNSMMTPCSIGPWDTKSRDRYVVHTGFGLVDGSFLAMLNSAYPEDRNNGALWGGRGVSSIASGGVILKAGVLSIGALPELTYQQNRPYEMLPPAVLGQSAYSSGLYAGIDEPQRFGAKSYGDADWGQSYARLDIGRVAVGISHENLWWGPGISNAVLFTNTAPGFPHVFLNTRRALNVGIGKLTGEAIWGRLSESAYFDTIAANNHRLIVGALLSFEPGWVRGLFLGIGRTFVVPWDSVDARNLFPLGQPFWKRNVVTPDNPNGSNDDQRVSLMARYVLADSKFELYGEWAREDHSWNGSDFVQEPEHSAGHVIGLQKLFTPHATRWVRVYAEASNLQLLRQNRPGVRTTSPFYIHAPQGHTQLGQLLGASIGPGGESEFFGVDIITRGGLVGWYLERVRRDEFAAIAIQAWSTVWPPRHDVTLSGGMRLTRSFGPLRLDADLGPSRRLNRNFIRTESQMRAQVRLTWVPPT